MGGTIIRPHRPPQLRVTIRLIRKAQEGLGQVLEFRAEKLVLLCLGEHISSFKTIFVCRPRHQRSPSASAKSPQAKSDALQSFPGSAVKRQNIQALKV
jgi:hypothetical protein